MTVLLSWWVGLGKKMAGVEKQEEDTEEPFIFRYPSNGTVYELRVPVKLPYTRDMRELAVRLIQGHNLPCYLEDQLTNQLRSHVQETTQLARDSNATVTIQTALQEDKVRHAANGVLYTMNPKSKRNANVTYFHSLPISFFVTLSPLLLPYPHIFPCTCRWKSK